MADIEFYVNTKEGVYWESPKRRHFAVDVEGNPGVDCHELEWADLMRAKAIWTAHVRDTRLELPKGWHWNLDDNGWIADNGDFKCWVSDEGVVKLSNVDWGGAKAEDVLRVVKLVIERNVVTS